MLEHDATQALTDVHRQLLDALARLETAGEFAAAAHVVAAIDLLETRIDVGQGAEVQPGARNPVIEIATRMQAAFGEKAEAVARRQLAAAAGPAMLAWAAIVNRIADTQA